MTALTIHLDHDPDLAAEIAWSAQVCDDADRSIALLEGPSAYDVLIAAAKEADAHVAGGSR